MRPAARRSPRAGVQPANAGPLPICASPALPLLAADGGSSFSARPLAACRCFLAPDLPAGDARRFAGDVAGETRPDGPSVCMCAFADPSTFIALFAEPFCPRSSLSGMLLFGGKAARDLVAAARLEASGSGSGANAARACAGTNNSYPSLVMLTLRQVPNRVQAT